MIQVHHCHQGLRRLPFDLRTCHRDMHLRTILIRTRIRCTEVDILRYPSKEGGDRIPVRVADHRRATTTVHRKSGDIDCLHRLLLHHPWIIMMQEAYDRLTYIKCLSCGRAIDATRLDTCGTVCNSILLINSYVVRHPQATDHPPISFHRCFHLWLYAIIFHVRNFEDFIESSAKLNEGCFLQDGIALFSFGLSLLDDTTASLLIGRHPRVELGGLLRCEDVQDGPPFPVRRHALLRGNGRCQTGC